jgi:transcriptional regulator with XRE-family HTH domain
VTAVALSLQIVPRLRELRGTRTLRELEQQTGLHRGTLSQLERGERLPRPADLDGLERAYGPRRRWYEVEINRTTFGLAVPPACSGETSAATGASAELASKRERGTGLCDA